MVESQQLADPELWAAECRRRRMLSLQGIDPLISRIAPKGSALLPRFFPPERHESVDPPADQQSVAPLADMAAALRKPKTPTTTSSERTAESPAAFSNNVDERVRFSLLIARSGSWIWVEALPDALLRREQLQLLQGMARAVEGVATKLQHQQFDWPLADHAHLPADLQSARQSVAAQLKRLAKDVDIRGWVVMGEQTQHYTESTEGRLQLMIPSTLAMLADPDLKKEAWQVLKPHVRLG